jgi:hypothetical protein
VLDRPPSSPAVRARKRRVRRRQGVAVLRVETHEHRLIEALLAAGRLTEVEALQRPLLERELGKLVEDWTARWLK